MTEITRAEMYDRVRNIELRRLKAFGDAGSGKGALEAMSEATTQEDCDTLNAARQMLDDFSQQVLSVYVNVWSEFGNHGAWRCGVCGRTAKQSAAIGYDCAREC